VCPSELSFSISFEFQRQTEPFSVYIDLSTISAVGAAVMGICAENVKHLSLAEECGLGTCNPEQIQVLGEPIEKVSRKFRTSFLSKIAQT
jgi:hypothetical protein